MIVSSKNADEAALIMEIEVFGVNSIKEMVNFLNGNSEISKHMVDIDKYFNTEDFYDFDFFDVKGQETAKRAMEIAAASGHNILMMGYVIKSGLNKVIARGAEIVWDI